MPGPFRLFGGLRPVGCRACGCSGEACVRRVAAPAAIEVVRGWATVSSPLSLLVALRHPCARGLHERPRGGRGGVRRSHGDGYLPPHLQMRRTRGFTPLLRSSASASCIDLLRGWMKGSSASVRAGTWSACASAWSGGSSTMIGSSCRGMALSARFAGATKNPQSASPCHRARSSSASSSMHIRCSSTPGYFRSKTFTMPGNQWVEMLVGAATRTAPRSRRLSSAILLASCRSPLQTLEIHGSRSSPSADRWASP